MRKRFLRITATKPALRMGDCIFRLAEVQFDSAPAPPAASTRPEGEGETQCGRNSDCRPPSMIATRFVLYDETEHGAHTWHDCHEFRQRASFPVADRCIASRHARSAPHSR
jgi:hypothetical protein